MKSLPIMYLTSARLKLDRADQHLVELDRMIAAFSTSTECTWSSTQDEVTGSRFHTLQFSRQPDLAFSAVIGDIVHNLRSALDLAVCEIARNRGLDDTKLYFPFAKSSEAFEKRVAVNPIAALGKVVIDEFRSIEPYPSEYGGNLHALHEMDIADKHRTLILASTRGVHIIRAGQAQEFDRFSSGIMIPKQEAIPAFTAGPFRGDPVDLALEQLRSLTHSAIGRLEAI